MRMSNKIMLQEFLNMINDFNREREVNIDLSIVYENGKCSLQAGSSAPSPYRHISNVGTKRDLHNVLYAIIGYMCEVDRLQGYPYGMNPKSS